MLKKNHLLFLLLITFFSCSVVPFSNRKRINIVPDDMMLNMSFTNYSEFLTQNPPFPESDANTKMVKEVGNKLAIAVSSFMNVKGMGDEIKDFKWEFNLVNNKEVNAFLDFLISHLDKVGFLKPAEKKQQMIRSVKNIFHRSSLSTQEIRTLSGVISSLIKYKE